MAVKDILRLHYPVDQADLVDQVNRLLQRLMDRMDTLDVVVTTVVNLVPTVEAKVTAIEVLTDVSILTLNADTTLTTADLGKSIRVNSSSNVTIIFPSVGLENDGAKVKIIKINSGNVVLKMVDLDKIGNSSAGGTCSNSKSTDVFAWLDLEYVHASSLWVMSGHGTWVTA